MERCGLLYTIQGVWTGQRLDHPASFASLVSEDPWPKVALSSVRPTGPMLSLLVRWDTFMEYDLHEDVLVKENHPGILEDRSGTGVDGYERHDRWMPNLV